MVMGALVGLLAGLAIVGFYRTLDLAGWLFDRLGQAPALHRYGLLAVVLFAGLGLARLLVRYGTGDAPGQNIPDVIHAVARRGGVLAPGPVLVKTLASAVAIASGGSVGAEGPVAVLGAATASGAGQWLGFRPDHLRLLVGCGTAAGISGAFGAPIAGVFFATEKILGGLRTATLAPLVLASVAAAAVTRNLVGPDHQLIRMTGQVTGWHNFELLGAAAVGVLGGMVGVAYNRGIWWVDDHVKPVSPWLSIPLAALVLAALALPFAPLVWGSGGLELSGVVALAPDRALWLTVAKLAATAITLSVVGTGGLFAPALVVGAALGAAIGGVLHLAAPGLVSTSLVFALAGMCAVIAGAMHSPLTAIFIVLEASGDWSLIVPLMLAGTLGFVVARSLYPESIYSEWLVRRGERISHGTDEAVLARLPVSAGLRSSPICLLAEQPLRATLAQVHQSSEPEFPVVDTTGALVGMFTLANWRKALTLPPEALACPTAEAASAMTETVHPGDPMLLAVRRLGSRGAQVLPVVSSDGSRRVVGVISRGDIFAAYEREVGAEGSEPG
ncbi:MAG TPA: chloride channel protein [Gemmatimonadales bacterium]|nr:chloride channel protein [Gemmatimonadales bacterium]